MVVLALERRGAVTAALVARDLFVDDRRARVRIILANDPVTVVALERVRAEARGLVARVRARRVSTTAATARLLSVLANRVEPRAFVVDVNLVAADRHVRRELVRVRHRRRA